MNVLSDAKLVDAALSDVMSAFQTLVDRYKRKIYFVSLGVVGNHHDAEDILQESLLQAYKSLDRLRNPDSFGPWILRMAYNRSVDLRRKRSREVLPDCDDGGVEFFDTIGSDQADGNPERSLNSQEIAGIVKRELKLLPDSQRMAFSLKHISQLSIKEIATVTKSSEATVKTNIYRAVQRIRAAILGAQRSFDKHRENHSENETAGHLNIHSQRSLGRLSKHVEVEK